MRDDLNGRDSYQDPYYPRGLLNLFMKPRPGERKVTIGSIIPFMLIYMGILGIGFALASNFQPYDLVSDGQGSCCKEVLDNPSAVLPHRIGLGLIAAWFAYGIFMWIMGWVHMFFPGFLTRGIGSPPRGPQEQQKPQQQNQNQYVPHGFDQQPLDSRLDPVGLYLKSLRARSQK
jgi:hypothetical protein